MLKRTAGIRLRRREEIEIHVFLVRQAAEHRTICLCDLCQHFDKFLALFLAKRARRIGDEIVRLALDLKFGDVKFAHFDRCVDQRVIVGRGESHRVRGVFKGGDYIPFFRQLEVNGAHLISMAIGL